MLKRIAKALTLIALLFILAIVGFWLYFFIIEPTQETTRLLEQTWNLDSAPVSLTNAVAFAHALRLNHEKMYELTNTHLHPRLDQWVEEHEVIENPFLSRRCETRSIGTRRSTSVMIECPTYSFLVKDIEWVYENGVWYIHDWSTVEIEPYSGPILQFP